MAYKKHEPWPRIQAALQRAACKQWVRSVRREVREGWMRTAPGPAAEGPGRPAESGMQAGAQTMYEERVRHARSTNRGC